MSICEAIPNLAHLQALDLRLIQAGPFGDCSRYARALLASANLPKKGTPDWKAHVLLGFVASLRLDPDDDAAPLRLGGWSFPETGPECLSAEQLDVLEQWLPDVSDPDLRARIAECLWLARKPRNHQHGRTAVDAYLDAASRFDGPDGHWPDAVDRFRRALQLAGKFGMIELVTTEIETALDTGDEQSFGPRNLMLMQLLFDRRLSDPAKYAPIAEALAKRGEAAAASEPPGTTTLFVAGEYWRAAAGWRARELGHDAEIIRSLRIRGAETFVLLADKSRDAGDPLVEAHHLSSAITTLRNAGAPRARVDALIARMMAAQRNAPLARFSHSIDVTKEVASGKRHVAGKDLRSALLSLAHAVEPARLSELREIVDETNSKFVAARLFPAALTSSDHRVVKHMPALSVDDETDKQKGDNNSVIRWQMWSQAQIVRMISSGYIEGARTQVLLDHHPRIAELMPLVTASWLVPPGHEQLFARGLHAGLHGDFIVACHILIPQLENGLRAFVQAALGKTMVTIDADGTQMVSLLKRLLSLQELADVLGEDLIFDLKGLLVMQESANLRNHLSHGLLGDRDFGVNAIYFWWLCLRLCVMLVPLRPSTSENESAGDEPETPVVPDPTQVDSSVQ